MGLRASCWPVLGLGLWLPLAAMAQPLTLSNQQARTAAWRALLQDRPAITLQIVRALRQGPTRDFELVFLHALALHDLGHETAATQAGKHAYRLAKTDAERFDAAHLVAKAHFAKGSQARAQFWLRRAAQVAPDSHAKELSVRDFRFIRQIKPWSTRAFFSLFPSSNINNGSSNRDIVVNGITYTTPASGLPLSGTGLTLGFETTYQKQLSPRSKLRLGLFAMGTGYRLSGEARALNTGKTGADFAFATIEARLGLTRAAKTPAKGAVRLNAALGHSWYGGNPLSVQFRVDAVQEFPLSARSFADLGVGIDLQNRLDDPNASSRAASLGFGLNHARQSGQRLRFGIDLRRTLSNSNLVENTAVGASLRYTLSPMRWDIRPTLTLKYGITDYTKSNIGGVQRTDIKTGASLSLFFPKISYYGFAPTLDMGLSKNRSTANIYSTHDVRISFGFNSTF